ncbi:MAG: folate-binding protein, partial [Caulobacteraceae bacterium]|nr:folate-binding protein [Caulobacteraceae bacterium]
MSALFVAARLPSRALIRVSGPDWRSFLQGLLTQDVETLQPGEMRYGALLTPQGKLLYDLFLAAEGEDGLVDVAAEHRDALIARLTIYRLRAKVTIAPDEAAVTALWTTDPDAEAPAGWLRDPRLSALGWRSWTATPPAGAELAD